MINPLHISIDGYLNSTLSIACNGYINNYKVAPPLPPIIQKREHQKGGGSYLLVNYKNTEEEVLLIFKTFLLCQN
jgi:hypothetical protein